MILFNVLTYIVRQCNILIAACGFILISGFFYSLEFEIELAVMFTTSLISHRVISSGTRTLLMSVNNGMVPREEESFCCLFTTK